MLKISVVFCVAFSIIQIYAEDDHRKPVYKYRYETEEEMKTAASSVPIRGYHVVEGGYYPEEIGERYTSTGGWGGAGGIGGVGGVGGIRGVGAVGGIGGVRGVGGIGGVGGVGGVRGIGFEGPGIGYGGAGSLHGFGLGHLGSGLGYGGVGPIGYGGYSGGNGGYHGGIGGPRFISGGGIGTGIGAVGLGGGRLVGGGGGGGLGFHGGYGGEEIDKKQFGGEKKALSNENFAKEHGHKEEHLKHGKEGFTEGNVALKDVKEDEGYYKNEAGGKKIYEDGKQYHGGHHFASEGKEGTDKKENKGHKKGHVIKGFKTSHHKDESGKTEEFFDEVHDEGGHQAFYGQSGAFGEKGGNSFKGGHDEGNFNAAEQKKSGHYGNEFVAKKANADAGKYGEHKSHGAGSVYGGSNGEDQQSLLGHQEDSRFFKHVPIYQHY